MLSERETETVARSRSTPDARPSWRGRLWRYGPLVLWLGFIFYASTGAMAASETSRIVGPLLRWLFPDISSETLRSAHFITRKVAHFAEYALLGLLAARAFINSSKLALRRLWFAASIALVVVYALLDEYHQSLVPTRTGTIWDSVIDTAGGFTALVLFAWWRARRVRAKLS
ncbi:MAG: VanZ family protein [Pyrinomonadaceae bacterium]